MEAETKPNEVEITLLFQRVEKLERENRTLKRIALVFCLGAVGLFTMGQVRPGAKLVPKVIEAEKFVLKDASGTEKARLAMTDLGPELKLSDVDSKGATFTTIGSDLMHMYRTTGDKNSSMVMGPGGVFFTNSAKDEGDSSVSMFASGPTIRLSDNQGFETTLGVANLETPKTGETHKTSAASIVLFNKDKTVIWRVPTP